MTVSVTRMSCSCIMVINGFGRPEWKPVLADMENWIQTGYSSTCLKRTCTVTKDHGHRAEMHGRLRPPIFASLGDQPTKGESIKAGPPKGHRRRLLRGNIAIAERPADWISPPSWEASGGYAAIPCSSTKVVHVCFLFFVCFCVFLNTARGFLGTNPKDKGWIMCQMIVALGHSFGQV